MRRPATIRQRTRIFLGCEGESEQSYGKLLQRMALERDISIAITAELLRPGGGDPLALVELACSRIKRNEQSYGGFRHKAVLLDADKLTISPDRDQKMHALAKKEKLVLIFQQPAHEAFLLRHLEGCEQRRPQSTPDALVALLREWPEYKKPMSAIRLAQRIQAEHILRASTVEEDLCLFLKTIGFVR